MKDRKSAKYFQSQTVHKWSSRSAAGQFQQPPPRVCGSGGRGAGGRHKDGRCTSWALPGTLCGRRTAPGGGNNTNTYHLLPSCGAWPSFSPKQVLTGQKHPGQTSGRPPDSFQKFSVQEGLWAGKRILAGRLPAGLGGGERIPHLGMNLQETTCDREDKRQRGRRRRRTLVYPHIMAYWLSHLFKEHLSIPRLLSDSHHAAQNSADTKGEESRVHGYRSCWPGNLFHEQVGRRVGRGGRRGGRSGPNSCHLAPIQRPVHATPVSARRVTQSLQ